MEFKSCPKNGSELKKATANTLMKNFVLLSFKINFEFNQKI